MIYGSAYMANVIVPYEIENQATTTIELQYGGVTSPGWCCARGGFRSGYFRAERGGPGSSRGLKPGQLGERRGQSCAARQRDPDLCHGEGQTSPPGVTGSLIGTDLKRPVLPVTVSIGGQDAVVQYAGSAGDSVAGLLQVNAVVPQSVTPGTVVPIVISVGGAPSQAGVTIAVQ